MSDQGSSVWQLDLELNDRSCRDAPSHQHHAVRNTTIRRCTRPTRLLCGSLCSHGWINARFLPGCSALWAFCDSRRHVFLSVPERARGGALVKHKDADRSCGQPDGFEQLRLVSLTGAPPARSCRDKLGGQLSAVQLSASCFNLLLPALERYIHHAFQRMFADAHACKSSQQVTCQQELTQPCGAMLTQHCGAM